jgi:hypothetical protein
VVFTVIEKLPERTAIVGLPSLFAIRGVDGLKPEHGDGPEQESPLWQCFRKSPIIIDQHYQMNQREKQPSKSHQVGSQILDVVRA